MVDSRERSAVPSADEAGFRGWAAARLPALRRRAYLLCGDWHLADDLVQDTLVTVYARWPRLVRQGAPDTYSSRVLVSRFIDERRRPWRRESPQAALPEAPDAQAGRELDAVEPFDRLLAEACGRSPPTSARCWCCATPTIWPSRRSPPCWICRSAP